jgi:phage/plasmid-like protein (TIGR03299 family)
MSADLSIRADGFVEHAYRGQAGWTGLGNAIPHDATLDEIIKLGGLDWEVVRAYVRFNTEPNGLELPAKELSVFKDKVVTFRSDTKAPLGVVSDDWRAVQPRQVAEFFKDLLVGVGLEIETLGVLQGGKRVWCMAKVGDDAEVVKGDKVMPYILVATSMDGTLATTIRFTTVRVVCHNTLRMAMGSSNGLIKVRHSTHFDIARAQRDLSAVSKSFALWMERAKELSDKPISIQQAGDILRELFAKPAQLSDEKTVIAPATPTAVTISKAESAILGLFQGAGAGSNIPGVAGTAWGLLNAVTAYVDHGMANSKQTAENRFINAEFGNGDDLKVSAFQALIAA